MKKLYLILFLSTLHTTSFSQYPPTYYLSGFNKVANPIADIAIWRRAETNPFQGECNSAWNGCTPHIYYDNTLQPNQQCWPDTIWIAAGKTVSVRSIEGFRGTLIIPQTATLIIEDGLVSNTNSGGTSVCNPPFYRLGELTAAFKNPNGKIIVAGTLINKKKLDIYGMMHITYTGNYIQDTDGASLNFYSFNSHPIYRESVVQSDTMVDNNPYLKIDAFLRQFKKGKLTFNNCKLGKNASLIEFRSNGQIYTDSISALEVIIDNNNTSYLNEDGYKISGYKYGFHVGKFELRGTAKVSMKLVALTCAEMILNPGTEFRADGSPGYWTRFDVYKNVTNNGTLIVDHISWLKHPSQRYESLPYSLSGNGTFRNNIVQANATASFSNLNFSTFNPRGIDIKTPISMEYAIRFDRDSIKVNLISDVLLSNFFHQPYNSLYPNSRIVCDGSGSLLIKSTPNLVFSSIFPIGTANYSTPLRISQAGSSNSADTFRIRALPLTTALDAAQCFPVMWEIKESTPAGNLGFAAAPILYNRYFSSQFSAPEMRLYEKKNSSWGQKNTVYTVSNSTALNYWQFNIVTQAGNFLGKDTLGVASGTGLLSGTSLPVKWIAFTAKTETQKAVLNWQMQESDVKAYIVQKAVANNNFINIETIASKGNGINTYTCNDINIAKATSYYRIMQIDNDGKYSYSKVVGVSLNDNSKSLVVFPNPVKDNLFVQVTSTKAEKLTLQVADLQGRILQQEDTQVGIGNVSLSVNTSALAKGTYVLLVKGSGSVQQKQFIKE